MAQAIIALCRVRQHPAGVRCPKGTFAWTASATDQRQMLDSAYATGAWCSRRWAGSTGAVSGGTALCRGGGA